jgi:hypothetical protein
LRFFKQWPDYIIILYIIILNIIIYYIILLYIILYIIIAQNKVGQKYFDNLVIQSCQHAAKRKKIVSNLHTSGLRCFRVPENLKSKLGDDRGFESRLVERF